MWYSVLMKYRDYLKSIKWKALSDAIKLRAHGRCQVCDKQSSSLDAHHIAYPPDWDHDSELNLIAVCRECHELIHNPPDITQNLPEKDLLMKLLVSMDLLRRQNGELHKRIKALEGAAQGSAKIAHSGDKTVAPTQTPSQANLTPKSPSSEASSGINSILFATNTPLAKAMMAKRRVKTAFCKKFLRK